MRERLFALAIAGACGVLVLLLAANAGASDARSIKQLRANVTAAEARLSEARHVLSETQRAGKLYGAGVGRWVWLAKDVGWEDDDIRTLTYIIYRESRGEPTACNPSSAAAGLLQFMPQWYNGLWSLPPFDPYDPRINLRMGLKVHRTEGWQPWAL